MRPHSRLVLALLLNFLIAETQVFATESPQQNARDRAPQGGGAVSSNFGSNVTTNGGTNRPAFQVSNVPQTIHGGIVIPGLVLAAERTQFSLLPPASWLVQSNPAEKTIRLVQSESGSLITVRVVESPPSEALPLTVDALRPQVLSRYPGAKIGEEFSVSSLGQSGPAFDLEGRRTNRGAERTRLAFIPFPGGHLECALTVFTDKNGHELHAFNQLLLSFRQAPLKGRLELQSVTPE